jgi:hypothetical protein
MRGDADRTKSANSFFVWEVVDARVASNWELVHHAASISEVVRISPDRRVASHSSSDWYV